MDAICADYLVGHLDESQTKICEDSLILSVQ